MEANEFIVDSQLVNGDFMLTFFHKPQANVSVKHYYAFTFPFTYTECQNQLANFDRLHQRPVMELDYIVCRLNRMDCNANTETPPAERIGDGKLGKTKRKRKIMRKTNRKKSTGCSHENMGTALANMSTGDLENEIYYHRELLINSVEGRRIDLMTITSFNHIQPDREFRFNDLFPNAAEPRCHTFKKKKIIFISSRVHPGETPASFVLNGFLKTILDKKNKFAVLLR